MSREKAPPSAPSVGGQPDLEQRFQCFLQAFLVSQETQASAHQQQTESFAQFLTQVMEVIERVAQPAQAVVPIQERDSNEIFEKFLKRGPSKFFGMEDPLVADDGIVRMDKIFNVFKRPIFSSTVAI